MNAENETKYTYIDEESENVDTEDVFSSSQETLLKVITEKGPGISHASFEVSGRILSKFKWQLGASAFLEIFASVSTLRQIFVHLTLEAGVSDSFRVIAATSRANTDKWFSVKESIVLMKHVLNSLNFGTPLFKVNAFFAI